MPRKGRKPRLTEKTLRQLGALAGSRLSDRGQVVIKAEERDVRSALAYIEALVEWGNVEAEGESHGNGR